MNPLTRLYRRSRAYRVVLYCLFLPLMVLVYVLSDDMWAKYTQVGDLTLLAVFLLFALWAWWYGEDRDRRRAARTAQDNGASWADGNGR
jgi:membrane protease YdiL (CAAX protease family)